MSSVFLLRRELSCLINLLNFCLFFASGFPFCERKAFLNQAVPFVRMSVKQARLWASLSWNICHFFVKKMTISFYWNQFTLWWEWCLPNITKLGSTHLNRTPFTLACLMNLFSQKKSWKNCKMTFLVFVFIGAPWSIIYVARRSSFDRFVTVAPHFFPRHPIFSSHSIIIF